MTGGGHDRGAKRRCQRIGTALGDARMTGGGHDHGVTLPRNSEERMTGGGHDRGATAGGAHPGVAADDVLDQNPPVTAHAGVPAADGATALRPDDRDAAGHLFGNLLRFGRLLHAVGLDVQAGGMLDVAEALGHVDVGRRTDFYHTLRTLLVRRAQDLPVFDEAFRLFWRPPRGERTARDLRALGERRRFAPPEVDVPPDAPAPGAAEEREDPLLRLEQVAALTYSARQVSRTKDFATFTDTEIADARALLAALDWAPATRTTRRWRAGAGPTVDVRRAVRHNLRFGGELVVLPRRTRRTRPRPLVLLCDVSGSMERYSRMLLHFVHTLARGFDAVETFLFSTTLTRVTKRLVRRGVDDVVPTLPRHVPDWSGGTRIGEALGRFNLDWSRRVMGHAPIVLLISDGWDRGEPARLGREMARLQRSCHRLVWLNPLLGSPRYRPLTRGMQAALPWIDDFLPVHNLASLESLAAHLNRLVDRRPARRQPPPPGSGGATGTAGPGASRRGLSASPPVVGDRAETAVTGRDASPNRGSTAGWATSQAATRTGRQPGSPAAGSTAGRATRQAANAAPRRGASPADRG